MAESIPIGISLRKSILERLDADRHDTSRSRYILRLIEKAYLVEQQKEKGDSFQH